MESSHYNKEVFNEVTAYLNEQEIPYMVEKCGDGLAIRIPLFGCDFTINMLTRIHESGLLEFYGPTTEDKSRDIITYCDKSKAIRIINTLKRQGYCSEYDVR